MLSLTTNSRSDLYRRHSGTIQDGGLGAVTSGSMIQHEAGVVPRPRHEAEFTFEEAELLTGEIRVSLSPAATVHGQLYCSRSNNSSKSGNSAIRWIQICIHSANLLSFSSARSKSIQSQTHKESNDHPMVMITVSR